jgi:CRP/FNR family cyclic AMP-dependent transcriptional regulator
MQSEDDILDQDAQRGLSQRLVRRFSKGESIFRAGDVGAEMFVVNRGAVSIRSEGGQELARLEAGQFFGEMALVDHLPRSATALADEEGTELAAIDYNRFVYLVSHQPAFALVVMQSLSKRLRGAVEGLRNA